MSKWVYWQSGEEAWILHGRTVVHHLWTLNHTMANGFHLNHHHHHHSHHHHHYHHHQRDDDDDGKENVAMISVELVIPGPTVGVTGHFSRDKTLPNSHTTVITVIVIIIMMTWKIIIKYFERKFWWVDKCLLAAAECERDSFRSIWPMPSFGQNLFQSRRNLFEAGGRNPWQVPGCHPVTAWAPLKCQVASYRPV